MRARRQICLPKLSIFPHVFSDDARGGGTKVNLMNVHECVYQRV